MSTEKQIDYADSIGATKVSISECHRAIIPILNAGHAPCLHGEAGIGKTEIARQIASGLGVDLKYFLGLVVSQLVSSDMIIPFRGKDGEYFKLMLSEMFEPIFEASAKGVPSFLFFDEITRYQDAETASFIFSILSDRRIGNYRLPDNCYIMAACNPDNGSYQVNSIISDPAWLRRLGHIVVHHDVSGWLRWAKESGIHASVIDFVSSNIDKLLDEKARAAGKIYANPASWAKVSEFLQENDNLLSVAALSTYVGYDTASDFVDFTENSEFKLSPATVISDWDTTQEVLARIEKAGRGDLITKLVTSLALYTYSQKPDPEEAAKNICRFWAHISSECKVKLATELFERKQTADAYYPLLMNSINSDDLWRTKILPEVKHCMG